MVDLTTDDQSFLFAFSHFLATGSQALVLPTLPLLLQPNPAKTTTKTTTTTTKATTTAQQMHYSPIWTREIESEGTASISPARSLNWKTTGVTPPPLFYYYLLYTYFCFVL